MLFIQHISLPGAKTSTCAAHYSLRRIQAVTTHAALCVPKTSTMFNRTVLLLGTVKCCKSHSASCVRTNTSDTRVVAKFMMVTLLIGGYSIVNSRRHMWIHIGASAIYRLSASRTVACISLTLMVIDGFHCSSNVLSPCSAFTEPIYSCKFSQINQQCGES